MKKLLVAAVALGLVGSASASTIDISMGTNFFKSNVEGANVQNGQCFTVAWNVDSDIALGFYSESTNYPVGRPLTVTALQFSKGVVKNVAMGLNLGHAELAGPDRGLVDVFGTVKMLSGSGDKIEGAVTATAAARFSKARRAFGDHEGFIDGVNLIMAVMLGF